MASPLPALEALPALKVLPTLDTRRGQPLHCSQFPQTAMIAVSEAPLLA